jgi:acyl carrier protein
MKNNILDSYEIENIEDCIPSIEKMYKFKFEEGETQNVKNFDEFCDLIISKIDFQNVESCTTQQAFYKLRNSLIEEKISYKEKIKPETKLNELFPRENRIKLVKKVEKNIGFKLNILLPPKLVFYTLVILSTISFISLFINFKFGISGIGISVLGFYLCSWFGKELEFETLKELVEKISSENYLEIRAQKNTVNKSELKKILNNWFAENTGIEKKKLINSTFE